MTEHRTSPANDFEHAKATYNSVLRGFGVSPNAPVKSITWDLMHSFGLMMPNHPSAEAQSNYYDLKPSTRIFLDSITKVEMWRPVQSQSLSQVSLTFKYSRSPAVNTVALSESPESGQANLTCTPEGTFMSSFAPERTGGSQPVDEIRQRALITGRTVAQTQAVPKPYQEAFLEWVAAPYDAAEVVLDVVEAIPYVSLDLDRRFSAAIQRQPTMGS